MNLLPIDSIDALKKSVEIDRNLATNTQELIDDIEDLLIMSYVYGSNSAAESLGVDAKPSLSDMQSALAKEYDGLTYKDRISKYVEELKNIGHSSDFTKEPTPTAEPTPAAEPTPTGERAPTVEPTPTSVSPSAGNAPSSDKPIPTTPKADDDAAKPTSADGQSDETSADSIIYCIKRLMDTESHRVYSAGAYDTAKRNGATSKVWQTITDGRQRDSHDYLDGIEVGIDDYFYTYKGAKALYPGQFGLAEEDVNCRCDVKYKK